MGFPLSGILDKWDSGQVGFRASGILTSRGFNKWDFDQWIFWQVEFLASGISSKWDLGKWDSGNWGLPLQESRGFLIISTLNVWMSPGLFRYLIY